MSVTQADHMIMSPQDVKETPTPLSSKKSQKKVKAASQSTSDFITFQSHAVAPTPLFCKSKGGCSTPVSSKKVKVWTGRQQLGKTDLQTSYRQIKPDLSGIT